MTFYGIRPQKETPSTFFLFNLSLFLNYFSVGCPTTPQFVTINQAGEALRQSQEAVIWGVCKQMKAPEQQ